MEQLPLTSHDLMIYDRLIGKPQPRVPECPKQGTHLAEALGRLQNVFETKSPSSV